MKTISIIGSILLITNVSFAIVAKPKPVDTAPTVKCEYMVIERDETGATKDFKYGQTLVIKGEKDKTTDTQGFTLKGSLKRICAMYAGKPKPGGPGGGPQCTNGYDLRVSIEFAKGISSSGQIAISKADKDKRLTVDLSVGNRQATANCAVQ